MSEIQDSILEVDEASEDAGYQSESASETLSLSSSINEYVIQNGRRYHAYFGPDKNPMPSDELEKERLDIVHEIALLIMGNQTHLAPLENHHQRVLDLGTGTGIWCVDFAEANPHTEVLGIDLTPIQPDWVPGNCRFEIDDFEQEWNFKRPFDFIHARAISQSVNDWPHLLEKAKSHLSPGGWFELAEWCFEPKSDDNSIPHDWPPAVAFELVRRGMRKLGRDVPEAENYIRLLNNAGFDAVGHKTIKVPMGTWPKKPELKQAGGLVALGSQASGYEAYCMQLATTVLGMGVDEVTELCKKAGAAHVEPRSKVHAYMELYVTYGRKPKGDP